MIFLTDFFDQAVVLPVVAAVAAVLALLGWWRGAIGWLLAVGVTFGAVLILKLGFLACGPVFGPWSLRSPSGHTAAAAMVAGGLAALAAGRRSAAVPVAVLAAGMIGATRVALGFHSVAEVCLGGAIGVAGAALLPGLAGRRRARRPVALLLAACVVAVVLHGLRLPAEAAIWHASQGGLDFVPACRGERGGPV